MFKFSIKNLLTRKAKFLMTAIAIIISSLIIMFSFNVAGQINDGVISTASYYDIVIGANLLCFLQVQLQILLVVKYMKS